MRDDDETIAQVNFIKHTITIMVEDELEDMLPSSSTRLTA
jgi:hypothetical protein